MDIVDNYPEYIVFDVHGKRLSSTTTSKSYIFEYDVENLEKGAIDVSEAVSTHEDYNIYMVNGLYIVEGKDNIGGSTLAVWNNEFGFRVIKGTKEDFEFSKEPIFSKTETNNDGYLSPFGYGLAFVENSTTVSSISINSIKASMASINYDIERDEQNLYEIVQRACLENLQLDNYVLRFLINLETPSESKILRCSDEYDKDNPKLVVLTVEEVYKNYGFGVTLSEIATKMRDDIKESKKEFLARFRNCLVAGTGIRYSTRVEDLLESACYKGIMMTPFESQMVIDFSFKLDEIVEEANEALLNKPIEGLTKEEKDEILVSVAAIVNSDNFVIERVPMVDNNIGAETKNEMIETIDEKVEKKQVSTNMFKQIAEKIRKMFKKKQR